MFPTETTSQKKKNLQSFVPAFFRALVLRLGFSMTASTGVSPMSSLGSIMEAGTWSYRNRSRSTSPTSKSSSSAAAYASNAPPSLCVCFEFER